MIKAHRSGFRTHIPSILHVYRNALSPLYSNHTVLTSPGWPAAQSWAQSPPPTPIIFYRSPFNRIPITTYSDRHPTLTLPYSHLQNGRQHNLGREQSEVLDDVRDVLLFHLKLICDKFFFRNKRRSSEVDNRPMLCFTDNPNGVHGATKQCQSLRLSKKTNNPHS